MPLVRPMFFVAIFGPSSCVLHANVRQHVENARSLAAKGVKVTVDSTPIYERPT